ncbi:DUF58 domain-containing protein [Botrimarina hoheduenensis]|uniref:DUF58 domain-containing protein n=1 Tax=Botrimarina hoheduenensis TaxID=2528000 RepID=A0A5C5W658_9BACT|nr:DUF58 domain-containing protein [Botrimarina hoheduenensis]TWT46458.1 hypothetical protein Pla111_15540 [Botrimarina hoheduenensis]
MPAAESYLKPDVIRQIARLDLRAEFIVKGFLQGLHASPFHGFSVEFSEHRKYTQGDDPKDIDWLAYAKTDRYYVKKFEAETNITGYLAMDLSGSMAYAGEGASGSDSITKFDYAICLAAALAYLMVHQQDPVGLVAFGQKIEQSLPPKSRRSQVGTLLSLLAGLKPQGETDVAASLTQLAAMLRHASLVMVFSDLLTDEEPVLRSLQRLRHGGHDVILFHLLDKAEVEFPFHGLVELEEPETGQRVELDADGYRADYHEAVAAFRERYREECFKSGVDYVPLDTSMPFDRALTEYLLQRRRRA